MALTKHNIFMGTLFLHQLIAKSMHREVLVIDDRNLRVKTHEARVATVELMSREIYRYKIQGAAAELGVYKGEFSKVINHYFYDRKLYLFDTFEGFDKRDAKVDQENNFSEGSQDWSQTSEKLVLDKMEHRENCIIRKGWFPDTAAGIDEKFCFVSIDADLYAPIKAGLEFFYPRLSHGGVIMIHDFNCGEYKGSREAVKEFCDAHNTGYVCLSDSWGTAVITR